MSHIVGNPCCTAGSPCATRILHDLAGTRKLEAMWSQRVTAAGRRGLASLSARLTGLKTAQVPSFLVPNRMHAAFLAGAVTAMPALTGEDFFEHKFITSKDPDAIVDFYSTEDFLQILGIFPMAIHFVLAGVQWDLEKENTMSVHDSMEISFTLTEREEETETGEKVVAFFQKRERFKNFIPMTRFLMWDQTQCYGYNRREDGTCEVFHRGEVFYGPMIVRLLVMVHARYVIWATEKHINSPAFAAADLEVQEHQRSNVPLHVFKDFIQRLAVAQQVAIETGKIAAGTPTHEAERTLAKLRKLRQSPTQAYVSTLQKANDNGGKLKRTTTRIEVSDPESQFAIDSALRALAKDAQGAGKAAEAMADLQAASGPKVVTTTPRYGGAFRLRELQQERKAPGLAA